jgi:TonB family protein
MKFPVGLIMLLLLSVSVHAQSKATGSICIAPPDQPTYGEKSLANPAGGNPISSYSIQVDKMSAVVASSNRPVRISSIGTGRKHLVKILGDGKVVQSFQSNESQKKPREANEYDQNAKTGMYFAVMSELSRANGQTEQAKVYAENAVRLLQNPSDDFELCAKGSAYVVLKEYDLALVNFDQIIQHDPQKIMAYIRRGRLHSQIGKFARALADFDKAIELYAESSAGVKQSKVFRKREDPSNIDIQNDPRPWFDNFRPGDAYLDRGRAYLQQDDNDRAIADFTKAIELDPEGASAYNHRGIAYSAKLDFDSAIADFDKAIQFDPLLKNAHYNRGLAFSQKGDEVRARADFAIEEQLFPRSTQPLNILNGRAVKLVKPGYPASARKAHVSGTVLVRVLIDEEGKVIAADVSSGHPLLWAACVEAAKRSLFSPTMFDDKPVKVNGIIQYNFIER